MMNNWHPMAKQFNRSRKAKIIIAPTVWQPFSTLNPFKSGNQYAGFYIPQTNEIFIDLGLLWKLSGKNPTRFKHNLIKTLGHEEGHKVADKVLKNKIYNGEEKIIGKFSEGKVYKKPSFIKRIKKVI